MAADLQEPPELIVQFRDVLLRGNMTWWWGHGGDATTPLASV